MKYKNLINNLEGFYKSPQLTKDNFSKITQFVTDDGYYDFINFINGGYFYNNSLQIYSIDNSIDFNSFFKINELIKKEYSNIISNEVFFAQEIFGNQFGFSSQGVIMFNIETGEKNLLSLDFNGWLEALEADIDFLTGKNIAKLWDQANPELKLNERLCAKKPFIIGGEYEIENLFALSFPQYVYSNANIANQVYGLPDGQSIKLKINP